MKLQSILLLSAILSTNLVLGNDPMAKIKVDKLIVNSFPNPYYDKWTAEFYSPGDIISAKLPLKKDLPETIIMKFNLKFMGIPLPEVELSLCEALEDETYAKDVMERGLPVGEFPTKCPIKAGLEYEIFKYVISNEKIIPGCPDGRFEVEIVLYEPGNDPLVTAHVEGDLLHTYPGLSGVPTFGFK
ncbi:uncharacterized protein LOC123267383 [Cotesia glomerata]|uniref:Phosphatidylglycerol/phosphatidylinositol transfer protein n=1 Tax=Cotesia glomerata TaxID=32391 RepID=A0AAV7HTB0_COTGL|nr:uncharacterized protein LOC123267383 [Cotesia glomerata]KAH0534324.1 hypothetical protein KQX54_003080 [Cotesia glomerata]